MSQFLTSLYRSTLRRTSTFALAIIVGTLGFEAIFDRGGDKLFEKLNRGKLFKDIQLELAQQAEEEE